LQFPAKSQSSSFMQTLLARIRRPNRWMIFAAKLLIVALVIWFIRRALVDAWRQLDEHSFHFHFGWLVVAGVLYLLGTLPCGIFWHHVLRVLGQPVALLPTLRAYYIGHLGKYVPGKAMVVILRAGLLRGRQVDTVLVTVSVFFETLTMMATGALIATVIVLVWFREQTILLCAAPMLLIVAGVPTLPPVFRRLTRWISGGRTDTDQAERFANLGYKTMWFGWGLTGVGWAILGLSFWAILRALDAAGNNPFEQFHLYTAAVTMATVTGFVSFVPGGAVVREAVMTEMMTPYFGGAAALIGAVLLRLVSLVAELTISGILWIFGRREQPTDSNQIDPP
jgi:uncharacterized membrane protein YbhN (UPF0104 family)